MGQGHTELKELAMNGKCIININTLWTGDADLRLYITTMQGG